MKNEQEIKKILGDNIKTRRNSRGWSQEELSEKTGVTKNTISDIECGDKFARAKTLVQFAKIFETEVYELLKPKDVLPDRTSDAIAIYSKKVKDAVDKVEKSFLSKKKDKNE